MCSMLVLAGPPAKKTWSRTSETSALSRCTEYPVAGVPAVGKSDLATVAPFLRVAVCLCEGLGSRCD